MENETLLSVGIDIGTTTTHLIISKIAIEVEGGFGTVPHAKISGESWRGTVSFSHGWDSRRSAPAGPLQ